MMNFSTFRELKTTLTLVLLTLAMSVQTSFAQIATSESPAKGMLQASSDMGQDPARLAEYNAILAQMQSEDLQTFYCLEDNLGFTWQVLYLGGLIDSSLFTGICTNCDDLWFMAGVYEGNTSGVALTYTRVDSASCPDEQTWIVTGLADGTGGIFGLAFGCSFFPSLYSADIFGGFCGFGRAGDFASIGSTALTAYPNPVSTANARMQLVVDLAVESDAQLMVYNNTGQLVDQIVYSEMLSAGTHNFEWDATGLPAGSYHAVLLSGGERHHSLLLLD